MSRREVGEWWGCRGREGCANKMIQESGGKVTGSGCINGPLWKTPRIALKIAIRMVVRYDKLDASI
jgi:hypothetical protein